MIERVNRVWQLRLEIRAKTVKTRVNFVPRVFSLSNMAVADQPFRSLLHMLIFSSVKLINV